jgi:hypothetical protein
VCVCVCVSVRACAVCVCVCVCARVRCAFTHPRRALVCVHREHERVCVVGRSVHPQAPGVGSACCEERKRQACMGAHGLHACPLTSTPPPATPAAVWALSVMPDFHSLHLGGSSSPAVAGAGLWGWFQYAICNNSHTLTPRLAPWKAAAAHRVGQWGSSTTLQRAERDRSVQRGLLGVGTWVWQLGAFLIQRLRL